MAEREHKPMQIRNLAELKRAIRPGMEFLTTSHSYHPDMVGLVRVVTEVQTNAFYSKIKGQPEHHYSTCNYGRGFRTDFEKAMYYRFDGPKITVYNRRTKEPTVLFEMEVYSPAMEMDNNTHKEEQQQMTEPMADEERAEEYGMSFSMEMSP